MATRPLIRTRPGAGFITILASLAILNILALAAGCSWGDGSYSSTLGVIRQGVPKPKQHAEPMPPMGGAQLSRRSSQQSPRTYGR